MKSYKKNYIGKGTQNENLEIVKVTVKVEEALKFKHEFNGEEYLTFEVAKLREPDKFDRTHTVYVSTLEDSPEKEEKKPVKAQKKRRVKKDSDENLPF
jgi:asparagine synthetase A